MADQLDSSLHNLHDLPDLQLGPEFHNYVQAANQVNAQAGVFDIDPVDGMDADDGTPMGTSGFQTQSEVSGSAFGTTNMTNGDSGSSDPSKLLGVSNSSAKRQRDGQNVPGTTTKRGSTMTGRFCGRLPTKEDEKRLVDECKLIGQYLNEDPIKLNTMATIIRGIASGTVRAYLADRAKEQAEMRSLVDKLKSQIEMIEVHSKVGTDVVSLTGTIVQLKEELKAAQAEISTLRKRNPPSDPHSASVGTGAVNGVTAAIGGMNVTEALRMEGGGAGQVIMERSLSTPMSLPGNAIEGQIATTIAPNVIDVNSLTKAIPQVVSRLHPVDANSLHLAAPGQPAQTQAPNQPIMQRSASAANISTVDNMATLVNQIMENDSLPPANKPIEAQVAGAHQFVRAATLHLVAKEEAAFNAHALTAEARKHSEASTKAAELANDLKKTLSTMTDSEISSEKAVEARKTVKNLETRAQMHASMTSQAVAKAKSMMEIAQNHEREQAIAIATATALQNKAATTSGSRGLAAASTGMGSIKTESLGAQPLEGVMSVMNSVMGGTSQTAANAFAASMPSMVPTSTVAKPDITSLVSNAQGNIGADGLPNTALNLQNAVPPPAVPLPLLDQSISYMHEMDPSIEATAFKDQIASMHAQQPESLVSAPPIHISDIELEGVNLMGTNPVVPNIPGLSARTGIPSLQDIPDIPDVDKVPSLDKLDGFLGDIGR